MSKSADRRDGGASRVPVRVLVGLVALLLAVGACDEDGVDPEALRFGQSGEIRVQLVTPTAGIEGERRQLLVWNSTGRWQLFESISYRGLVGDESRSGARGDAASYAALISNVNEAPGSRLFVDGLDPELDPDCGEERAALTVIIRDDVRNREESWVRCVRGPLENLTPEGAGPDPAASRVAQVGQWARDWTVGAEGEFRSAFHGSLPFGTLDRGSDSDALVRQPLAILPVVESDSSLREPRAWPDFWEKHAGPGSEPPEVDWSREMVILGFVGRREEAGDSVEVKRILPVADGTQVEVGLRVPGDFCAPAAGTHVPYHIVVAPLSEPAIRFSDIRVERVPCTG